MDLMLLKNNCKLNTHVWLAWMQHTMLTVSSSPERRGDIVIRAEHLPVAQSYVLNLLWDIEQRFVNVELRFIEGEDRVVFDRQYPASDLNIFAMVEQVVDSAGADAYHHHEVDRIAC